MEQLVRIAARLLSAYFIALPIMFGYHMSDHQHDLDHTADSAAYDEFVPHCDLCDLYHSQSAVVESTDVVLVAVPLASSEPVLKQDISEISKHLHFLRGPPVA